MCESSGSLPISGKKSGTSTPDELGVALSPASCPPELGAGGKPTDLFGEETAPPHMSDEWRLHEGTDMQVCTRCNQLGYLLRAPEYKCNG